MKHAIMSHTQDLFQFLHERLLIELLLLAFFASIRVQRIYGFRIYLHVELLGLDASGIHRGGKLLTHRDGIVTQLLSVDTVGSYGRSPVLRCEEHGLRLSFVDHGRSLRYTLIITIQELSAEIL